MWQKLIFSLLMAMMGVAVASFPVTVYADEQKDPAKSADKDGDHKHADHKHCDHKHHDHKHHDHKHHAHGHKKDLLHVVVDVFSRLKEFRKDLNLTDKQRDQVCTILRSHREEILKQARDLWQQRNAVRDAVLAEGSDEAKVRAAAEAMGKEIGNAAVLAHKIRNEIAPVLTSEQRQTIGKFIHDADGFVKKVFDRLESKAKKHKEHHEKDKEKVKT